MSFVLWEILIPLIVAFLLGLLFGWLWWGWRRTKITYTEWETMRQKAARSSSIEAESELAELRAENERLRAQIDHHVCEVTAGDAALGAGVLGVSGAAAADDSDDGTDAATSGGDAGAGAGGTSDAADDDTTAPQGLIGTSDDANDSDSDDANDSASASDDANDDAGEPVAGGERHPYGPGSHAPFSEDAKKMPEGYPIKGNADSMLYHREDSRSYRATIPEVWFDTPESAEAAGFGLANSHPS